MPQNQVSAPVDEGTASVITPPEGPTDTGALTEQPGQKQGSASEPAPEEPAPAAPGEGMLPDSLLAPGASVIQD